MLAIEGLTPYEIDWVAEMFQAFKAEIRCHPKINVEIVDEG
jgi:hypothetical protein